MNVNTEPLIPRPEQIMSWEALLGLRQVTAEEPLRVLMSACLNRRACLYDGSSLGHKGPGLYAAMLIRHGIPVLSQRDDRSLQLLRSYLEPGYQVDPEARDHHEREWYRDYFGKAGR